MRLKSKSFSEKTSLLSAALSLVTVIVFCIYGFIYDYMDSVVILTLLIGIAGSAVYALVKSKAVELLNLLAVISVSFSVGLFFLNSYPVWADRLNNITMYASRGTLVPVIAIIIMMFATIIIGIVSCFTAKGGKINE